MGKLLPRQTPRKQAEGNHAPINGHENCRGIQTPFKTNFADSIVITNTKPVPAGTATFYYEIINLKLDVGTITFTLPPDTETTQVKWFILRINLEALAKMIEGVNAFYMMHDVGIPPINMETHTDLIFKGLKFHQVATLYEEQKMKGHLEHLLWHQDEVLAHEKRIKGWKTIENDDDHPVLEKRIKTEETGMEGFIKANPRPIKPVLEEQEEEKQASSTKI